MGGAKIRTCAQIRSHAPHVPMPKQADKEAAQSSDKILVQGENFKFFW